MTEHISRNSKYKFNSTTCNSRQKRINKTCQCKCKNDHNCENNYTWNPSTCIFKNKKYLKSVADTSVTECHEVKISILKLLSLKLKIRSEFLRTFLVKMTMKIGHKRKFITDSVFRTNYKVQDLSEEKIVGSCYEKQTNKKIVGEFIINGLLSRTTQSY